MTSTLQLFVESIFIIIKNSWKNGEKDKLDRILIIIWNTETFQYLFLFDRSNNLKYMVRIIMSVLMFIECITLVQSWNVRSVIHHYFLWSEINIMQTHQSRVSTQSIVIVSPKPNGILTLHINNNIGIWDKLIVERWSFIETEILWSTNSVFVVLK